MSVFPAIRKGLRLVIKVIGFIDGILDESDRERAKEQAVKEAALRKMNNIVELPVRINPNGR